MLYDMNMLYIIYDQKKNNKIICSYKNKKKKIICLYFSNSKKKDNLCIWMEEDLWMGIFLKLTDKKGSELDKKNSIMHSKLFKLRLENNPSIQMLPSK